MKASDFDLEIATPSERVVGIYVNDREDADLFLPGRRVGIVYALDELKQQPAADGGVNYFKRLVLREGFLLQNSAIKVKSGTSAQAPCVRSPRKGLS
jgi:hypothetical protein